MARLPQEENDEKCAELRAQLNKVEDLADADHRLNDVNVVDAEVAFADWAWRMITALRQEVRRSGGDLAERGPTFRHGTRKPAAALLPVLGRYASCALGRLATEQLWWHRKPIGVGGLGLFGVPSTAVLEGI